ncbi:CHAT domain-containing protein [Streptomyces sp. NPDC001941]|uniref:CHAT domain-containing tetratricopeptide repeat protein n=1 Tax=Streptomyces sp. NPDC001941 TaxID=3154659 RepID=UPI00332F1E61
MGEREELLAAVRGRVERVAATGDGSAVLDPAAFAEAWSLARMSEAGVDLGLDARHVLGWLHHYRAAFAAPEQAGTDKRLPEQAVTDRRLAVHWLTECFVAGREPLPEVLLASLAEQAVPAALRLLGLAQSTFDPAVLEKALDLCRRVVGALPEDHRARPAMLSNLGTALLIRSVHTASLADLDQALQMARAAVRTVPGEDPERPRYLSNLGLVLRARFERAGVPADLDEAVEALRAAAGATAPDDPDRVDRLYHLGLALGVRFERTAALADLDEEAEVLRTAARTAPAGHPDRARYQSVLGGVLRTRFERTGDARDLDEGVRLARAAVQAAPEDRHDRAQGLSGLSFVLVSRFHATGTAADLDEAVAASREAVRVAPVNYPVADRAMLLFGLGAALRVRYEHARSGADLDEAVEAMRRAVDSTPADYPLRATYQAALGDALRERSERDGAARRDRAEQLALWTRTVEERGAAPRLRVLTAREAARWAADSDPALAARLLEQAVLLLPELAPRRLERGDQQYVLGALAPGLAAEAASLALADPTVDARERPARALRLAEAGRAVLLSQALETRGDLTDLDEEHPDLAERFRALRALLDQDQGAVRDQSASAGDLPEPPDHAGPRRRARHEPAGELEALLVRIRACEGFAAFGLPPTLDELRAEAAQGPVVTFNISRYRSDALLLTRDGVTSCPLPLLTEKAVVEQVNAFHEALAETTAPDGRRVDAQRTLCRVLAWLWDAAAEPVLSALADELRPAGPELPRLWWAPGGMLGLLPLHAAGHHASPGQGPHGRTVLDRVVSSYTPTVRALRHARRPRPLDTGDLRSLIVAMPTTPGLARLPYVPEEARRLAALLPRPTLLTEPAPDPGAGAPAPPADRTPTLAAVLARLPECAVAHFACHAVGDRTDPSLSRLFLHDHASAPLTVAALARVSLGRARLAFLSACGTADPGRADLLDESIHLAGAFQLAGFPHVVATLWPIDDRLAVTIAESFYAQLAEGPSGPFDPDRSATALHHAIRAVRDRYPRTPSLWASHLHTGA